MKMLTNWIIGIVGVLITVWICSSLGLELVWAEKWNIIIFVPVLALSNMLLGSLLRLVTAPVSCLTLGLFGFIVNAIVFYVAARLTGATLSFWAALVGSICLTIICGALNKIFDRKKE